MPLFDCDGAQKFLGELKRSSDDGAALCSFLTSHADELDLLPPVPPAPLKVVCTLTKHELPAKLGALEDHWSGRSYRRALAQDKSVENPGGYDFEQHLPHIVPHRQMKKHLWCYLTKKPIEKSVRAITNHVNSKRFKRTLESWRSSRPDLAEETEFGAKLQQFDEAEMALCEKETEESALEPAELALCEEEKRRDKVRKKGVKEEMKQAAAAADGQPVSRPAANNSSQPQRAKQQGGKPPKRANAQPQTGRVAAAVTSNNPAPQQPTKRRRTT